MARQDDAIPRSGDTDAIEKHAVEHCGQGRDGIRIEVHHPKTVRSRPVGEVDELFAVSDPPDVERVLRPAVCNQGSSCSGRGIDNPYFSLQSEICFHKGDLQGVR